MQMDRKSLTFFTQDWTAPWLQSLQVSDLQHIYNKLLFDAIGEALTKVLLPSATNAPSWLQKRVFANHQPSLLNTISD